MSSGAGPGGPVNDYEGPCAGCGAPVPAGTGVLRHRHGGGWDVYHPGHAREPAPPPRRARPGWHRRALLALDIATTGNRAAVDRILSVALRGTAGDGDWMLDPGPGPLSVAPGKGHGVTLARARAEGMPAAEALDAIAGRLAGHLASGEVLVVWFAPHVLGTLHAELLRHGVPTLTERLPAGVAPVCDPLVLDRHADRYRPGRRSLEAVAEWYGIPHARPGEAASDAETTLVLARTLAACHPALARLSRPALHTEQIRWNADRTRRHPDAPDWPFTALDPLPWRDPPRR
ncbi:3'-5' exonuclease [Streptomyces sp. NBC_01216]|uniref:3'-5' exonuclease n=1 Tax=unclassified Streptomyces TaxID=2593676 RepID=UPI002E0F88C6|nr:3'-5' exonuclease [Streptomyces sp. NBC_01216]